MLVVMLLQTETATGDAEIQNEYSRQREHLERSVASLRKKLAKDSEIHRADNVRIMQVWMTLTRARLIERMKAMTLENFWFTGKCIINKRDQ